MKKILRFIEYPIALIFNVFGEILGKLIKKDSKLIIFGAMGGFYYGDNAKYVFEELSKSNYKIYWLTRKKNVLNEIKNNNLNVASVKSIKGIYLLFKAKLAVYTNNLGDFSLYPTLAPSNLKLISLRHGRSVKRVRYAKKVQSMSRSEILRIKKETKMIEYVISTSEFISKIQSEVLKLKYEKNVITGYPRNDILFKDFKNNIILDENKYNKLILYGPTWRHGRNPVQFFPFNDLDLLRLNRFLKEKKIVIFLRPHKNELKKESVKTEINYILSNSDNIRLMGHDEFPSINEYLNSFDALICDYSALYHDYLLLDKPILFIPYDYSDFNRNNGFLYDYHKLLPGPLIKNFNMFNEELNKIHSEIDNYNSKRKTLRDLIHKYQDSKSTKRVVEIIDKVMISK